MIRARTLMILLAITGAVVAGALVASAMRAPDRQEQTTERLFPGLADRINDVAEIEITTTGGRRVDLRREGDSWVDASRGGFPAKFEPVKQLLVAFAEAEIAEHKTSDPAFYPRLGVVDRDAPDSKSTLVVLRDAKGDTIVSVLIGTQRPGGDGRFVRMTDQSEVLLTAAELSAPTTPLSWLEREVIRVPRDSVQRVSVAQPNGDSYSIVRTPEGKFDMIGVPEGRRVRAQGPLAGVIGAIAYVDFTDVKPIDDVDFSSLRTPLLATYETSDGMVIDVTVWGIERTKWTTFSVSRNESADESGASDEALDERIARLQEKLAGWLYQVSPSTLVPIETSMLELTQEIPDETPASGPPAPPAPTP